jgi:hypothetical protein
LKAKTKKRKKKKTCLLLFFVCFAGLRKGGKDAVKPGCNKGRKVIFSKTVFFFQVRKAELAEILKGLMGRLVC